MLSRLLRNMEPTLIRLYRWMSEPAPPNLKGDRDIEFSWILANLRQGPGQALEFGCGSSVLSLVAARRGFSVTAIDLTPVRWPYAKTNLRFVQGDILELSFPPSSLDLIINCSAIEHVGLGRYGDGLNSDGDLKAMRVLQALLKPGGTMLLTIPVGLDATVGQMHRVYGPQRLPRLLEGFVVEAREFWTKDPSNRWVLSPEEEALKQRGTDSLYALGCFVLKSASSA